MQEIDDMLRRIVAIAEPFRPKTMKVSQSEAESAAIWKGRKSAFGATGRVADYICMDGTIPTGQLPYVLKRIDEIVKSYGLGVANVFHAGDGNLHPLVMFNTNEPGEMEKAEKAGEDILKLCVEVGGCLTGEHGVGIEKRDLMTLSVQRRRSRAADARARRVRSRSGCSTRPRCFRSKEGSPRDDSYPPRRAGRLDRSSARPPRRARR